MIRTETTVRMLQAIAMIASFAVLLWSLGLPSLQFTAQAANLTQVSDTLSDSAPGASSNHTFQFSSPTGVVNGEYATVTMPADFTNVAALTAADVTVDIEGLGAQTVAANCAAADNIGFSTSGQNLVFELCATDGAVIGAGGTTTIVVGNDSGNQMTNPTPVGDSQSYEIDIIAGAMDFASTRVVILSTVTVTASVDTVFTFSVSGLPGGYAGNGYTTTGQTTTTTIPFGSLEADTASTAAQRLEVRTNASNGYVVTVQADGAFESATGATIDDFVDGSATNSPQTWVGPSATLGDLTTYGHWGVISDDTDTTRDAADEFGSGEYVAASTSPIVVMSNDGPSVGSGVGVGTTTVGYRVQISSLQEAADDYEAVLTYIATPTF